MSKKDKKKNLVLTTDDLVPDSVNALITEEVTQVIDHKITKYTRELMEQSEANNRHYSELFPKLYSLGLSQGKIAEIYGILKTQHISLATVLEREETPETKFATIFSTVIVYSLTYGDLLQDIDPAIRGNVMTAIINIMYQMEHERNNEST